MNTQDNCGKMIEMPFTHFATIILQKMPRPINDKMIWLGKMMVAR
jgi:hypothetical protein